MVIRVCDTLRFEKWLTRRFSDEAFHEWSEKYGSTFSFTVFSDTRVSALPFGRW